MTTPKKSKPIKDTGWAVFKAGYWIVCPTLFLANQEAKSTERPILVEIKEVTK